MRAFVVFPCIIILTVISCAPVMQNSRGSGGSSTADEITVMPRPERSRGLITGTMLDAGDKTPLPGGVIIIQDSPFGVNTDIHGRYYINNLKPGIYTIKGKYMAYYPVIVRNVRIVKGFSTVLDFRMVEHHLDHPDYLVEVADSMISMDAAARTITINIGDVWKYKQNRIYFPDNKK